MEDRARILEDRVEDLARTLAETINEADVPGRPALRSELRDFAISVIQDGVALPEPPPITESETTDAAFNPLGMGIPVFFAGAVLIFLFPPVGLMLLAVSAAMIVWGLLASVWSRR